MEALVAAFRQEFGRPPEGIAEAPGRVNLIGEHVDYNDGLVLPFAINRSIMVAWGRDAAVPVARWVSLDYRKGGRYSASQAASSHDVPGRWGDYVVGVQQLVKASGGQIRGLVATITGDVPPGAGLSSSAALEIAAGGAMREASAIQMSNIELALLCQRAENEFVGVQCGIMDQFASALSQRDCALLIDCRTLAYEAVPLRLGPAGLSVVIANSGASRELAGSAYNQRRRECEQAVALLRERLGRPELASLRDVTQSEIDAVEVDAVPLRRARHVVSEIARVGAAVEALRRDDFAALGGLMAESHISLRDDYEVSSPELDLLVGLATAQDYVAGARLTGAGFGGCTVNLVRSDAIAAFERDVVAPYRARTGLQAEMYVTGACDGLRAWRL